MRLLLALGLLACLALPTGSAYRYVTLPDEEARVVDSPYYVVVGYQDPVPSYSFRQLHWCPGFALWVAANSNGEPGYQRGDDREVTGVQELGVCPFP